jgi:hypothetical protein
MDPINFDPYLVRGLRPRPDVPRGAPYMQTYTNLMACERRAKALPTVGWPANFPTVSENWPPAEAFFQDRSAIAMVDEELSTINVSALTSSSITLYTATDTATEYSVNGTGPWHFAAFLDSWFTTNGHSLIYKAPSTADNKIVGHHSAVNCQTLCNWNNRLVLGGLSGSRFSSNSWSRFENLWRSRNKRNVVTSEDDAFDTSWLLIGPPVGGDSTIPNGALMALLGLPSDAIYTAVFEPQVMSWAEQGLIDLLPLRHVGGIEKAMVYGGDLIVYGTEGVSRVTATEIGPLEEQISPVGVWGRGAAGGDVGEQLMLGKDGEAYMVGQGAMRYALEGVYMPEQVGRDCFRLGWSEYLGGMNAGEFLFVVHDPANDHYWFADGDEAFLLTRTGLCRSLGVIPSCALRLPGQTALVGAALEAASGADQVNLRTVPFDLGRRDPFTVERIDMTTTDTASSASDRWVVRMHSKLHKHLGLTTFPDVTADVRGVASVEQLGVEHSAEFEAADRTKVDLDGAVAYVSDKTPSMRKVLDALGS